jgi:hypothetical protein
MRAIRRCNTAQIAWVPKPAYSLTLRTPLYLVRN